MDRVIGTCSLCGGDVVAYEGIWMSVLPPPPPTCSGCRAVKRGTKPVIDMEPSAPSPNRTTITTAGTLSK
jgi:hypothetical protein